MCVFFESSLNLFSFRVKEFSGPVRSCAETREHSASCDGFGFTFIYPLQEAGPFEQGPAAKSTRAELYGDECDEGVENCFRHLGALVRNVADVHGRERCESV